jgi:hypothetical protein
VLVFCSNGGNIVSSLHPKSAFFSKRATPTIPSSTNLLARVAARLRGSFGGTKASTGGWKW